MVHSSLQSSGRTQAEWLSEQIREDVIRGRFKPGERLGMVQLQAVYDVSLTPLREALSRLTSLGLVTAEGQRGFRVAQISSSDLLDLIKTLVWVDEIAITSAIANGDRDWEASVIAAAHLVKTEPTGAAYLDDHWEHAHRAFHRTLVQSSKAARLLEFRSILYDNVERYRRLSSFYERGDRDIDGEHARIAEAMVRRDVSAAIAASREHLLITVKVLLEADPATRDQADELLGTLIREIEQGHPPQRAETL